jgi:adenine/guanine phosphoribosyltransferase-like PRPP-binding protein
MMSDAARPFNADIIVGLPTLGLTFVLVAKKLGFNQYKLFGYSRKYWCREDLSISVSSITTPHHGKLLYSNLMELLQRKRVLMVDDAVSSGQSMVSALTLLKLHDTEVSGMAVAMRQGTRWRDRSMDEDGMAIPLAYKLCL